jgi:hypothetical protein
MSKLHDDLINEVEPADTPEDSVHALMMGIADRIEGCYGNPVKLSDLCAILREDTAKVGRAVINNTPAMRTNKTSSTGGEAPGTTFQKQRSDVRQGMADNTNDHRDQQYPETDNTQIEQERIRREQTARDRGQSVVVNEPLV